MAALLQLSDYTMHLIMQYLDVPDLLACRLVCRKLGALALDPGVWRHRKFVFDNPSDPLVCPVLRLAPCLKAMVVRVEPPLGCHRTIFATTRCRFGELSLVGCGANRAPEIILHQEALGGLRCLRLRVDPDTAGVSADDVAAVLGIVASSTSGVLEELQVDVPASTTVHHILGSGAVEPSLKRLTCWIQPESFCKHMLAAHAATLEMVSLYCRGLQCEQHLASMSLLAGMPKLQALESNLCPGLEAVAACPSLTKVRLRLLASPELKFSCISATKLLRTAKHLRDVALEYYYGAEELEGLVMTLATGASRNTIEALSVCCSILETYELDKPLLEALPLMPRLRRLAYAREDLKRLLRGVTPVAAPALERLELKQLAVWDAACAHSWLHRASAPALLAANPTLQVVVPRSRAYCTGPPGSRCSACDKGCHRGLKNKDLRLQYSTSRFTGDVTETMLLPRDVPK